MCPRLISIAHYLYIVSFVTVSFVIRQSSLGWYSCAIAVFSGELGVKPGFTGPPKAKEINEACGECIVQ